ncbi:MAG: hypothetical protein QNK03_24205 [Myxococcota bacterium]|nr:hypothetical protein [Myxococcota bacterium]
MGFRSKPLLVPLVTWLALLALAPRASAVGPDSIEVQTLLLHASGGRVDGHLATVEVGLFDALEGGRLQYRESLSDVAVVDGVLQLRLGTGPADPIPPYQSVLDAIVAGGAQAAEISIEGEVLMPRRRLGAAAFALIALHAEDADTLGGVAGESLQRVLVGSCPSGSALRAIAPDGQFECEPDDGILYAAGSGLQLDGTTFSVDLSTAQARLSAGCPADSFLRGVQADGQPICESDRDADTQYGAGEGLALNGTTLAIDPGATQLRVATACPAQAAIRSIDQAGAITCESILTGDVTAVTALPFQGLSGGCTSGTCSLFADFSRTQSRITQSCPPGTAVRTVGVDGSVSCTEVFDGDITGLVDGPGIRGVCTSDDCTLTVDFDYVQRKTSTSCLFFEAIGAIDADGTLECRNVGTGDITGVRTLALSGLDGGCISGECSLQADPTDFLEPPELVLASETIRVAVLTVTPVTIASDSITAPPGAGGTVVALASADVECAGNCGTSGLASTLTTSLLASAQDGRFSAITVEQDRLFGTFVSELFPIGAGETLTVYWRGGIVPGQSSAVDVYEPQLSLLFIPH